ncbi:unnamed protein product [Protopolystoma xenopodis]|uniref:Uncharacterized protein n=1 Tax=Protopolystoma xenopodis TaxID=117903 RepID=A0A448XFR4_9PLAT|nr:unnamed protein product [Protopolystoma xenopodis]
MKTKYAKRQGYRPGMLWPLGICTNPEEVCCLSVKYNMGSMVLWDEPGVLPTIVRQTHLCGWLGHWRCGLKEPVILSVHAEERGNIADRPTWLAKDPVFSGPEGARLARTAVTFVIIGELEQPGTSVADCWTLTSQPDSTHEPTGRLSHCHAACSKVGQSAAFFSFNQSGAHSSRPPSSTVPLATRVSRQALACRLPLLPRQESSVAAVETSSGIC